VSRLVWNCYSLHVDACACNENAPLALGFDC
jgi:hypothetical protein